MSALLAIPTSFSFAADFDGNDSNGLVDVSNQTLNGSSAYGLIHNKDLTSGTIDNGRVIGSHFSSQSSDTVEFIGAAVLLPTNTSGQFVLKSNAVTLDHVQDSSLTIIQGAYLSGQFNQSGTSVEMRENETSLDAFSNIAMTNVYGAQLRMSSVNNAISDQDAVGLRSNQVSITNSSSLTFTQGNSAAALWGILGGSLYISEFSAALPATVGGENKEQGNSVLFDDASVAFATSNAHHAWVAGAGVYITSNTQYTERSDAHRRIQLSNNVVNIQNNSKLTDDVSLFGAILRIDKALDTETTYALDNNQMAISGQSSVEINGLVAGALIDHFFTRTSELPTILVEDNELVVSNAVINNQARVVAAGMAYSQSHQIAVGKIRVTQAADVTVQGNHFSAQGSTVKASVYGGYAESQGGGANKMNRWDCSSTDTIHTTAGENWGFNSGYAHTNDNSVEIRNDSLVDGYVFGGYAFSSSLGGAFVTVMETPAEVLFQSGNVEANSNVVVVENSEIKGHIHGGYAVSVAKQAIDDGAQNSPYRNKDAVAGYATANDNKVILIGSTVSGMVYGAYVHSEGFSSTGNSPVNGQLTANNNQITIGVDANLTQSQLYGSNLSTEQTQGNALIVDGFIGSVQAVDNFNKLIFKNLEWTQDSVLAVSGGSLAQTMVTIEGSVAISGNLPLAGSQMILVEDRTSKLGLTDQNIVGEKEVVVFNESVATQGLANVSITETGDLILTMNGSQTPPTPIEQTTLLAENRAIGAAFIAQTEDLIPDALNAAESYQLGLKSFALMEGAAVKYDVNTDLKINGWYGLWGAGSSHLFDSGLLISAAFFEMGKGNYRTDNTFNEESFRGAGELEHYGLGLALRYREQSGIYAEFGLRGGILRSEMQNALKNIHGEYFDVDSDSYYWNLQVALGKTFKLNESNSLDLYGRFYHTYNEGDNFSVGIDRFEAESITSDKFRFGARYAYNAKQTWCGYLGVGWEYELNGEARMHVDGMDIPVQSTSGATGFGELGLNWQIQSLPVELEARLKGYVGQRQGVAGMLRGTYKF